MMNVIRNQALSHAYVIPGETIKGLLRSSAYALCVEAGRLAGDLKVSLEQFYRQTLGGLSFASESRELGSDASIRVEEPLLSLFGAANPRITGRIIVHHALAQGDDRRPAMRGESAYRRERAATGSPPALNSRTSSAARIRRFGRGKTP